MPVSRTPLRAAWTLRLTPGVTPCTWVSCAMSSRSPLLSPAFRSLPGVLTDRLPAPMEVKESEMEVDTPEMVVISAITAVTPIMMPRIVRKERSLLAVMLATAIDRLSISMLTAAIRLRIGCIMRRSPRPRIR